MIHRLRDIYLICILTDKQEFTILINDVGFRAENQGSQTGLQDIICLAKRFQNMSQYFKPKRLQ